MDRSQTVSHADCSRPLQASDPPHRIFVVNWFATKTKSATIRFCWKHALLPLSMSICLDVWSPLRNIILSFQKNCHDPVKAFHRVQDFTWNMAKLQLLIGDSLDSPNSIMTTYKKFLRQSIEKESENDGKIWYFYQDVKFKKFQISKNNVLSKTTLRLFETSQPAWKSVFLICMNHHYLNTWSVC